MAIALAAALLLTTSCASETNGGAESLGSEEAKAYSERHGFPYYENDPYQEPYHPCIEIPDDALRATGVDPETAFADTSEVPSPGWRICRWNGPGYMLSVYTMVWTLDELYSHPMYHQFRDITIAGREGVELHAIDEPEACTIAFPAAMGMTFVATSVLSANRMPPGSTFCALAAQHAADLDPHLPQL
ncbi:DUF3558 domain-containing protein [Hoyosella altamirensis]|uniref:DUF3558 domain-containing protein n=1 Tax=Hoyosella altamirensis TaxID=616997 RepID=UPI0007DB2EEE|nr:DUF3558 domain-containing protein [Hoyosella altamirensis]